MCLDTVKRKHNDMGMDMVLRAGDCESHSLYLDRYPEDASVSVNYILVSSVKAGIKPNALPAAK